MSEWKDLKLGEIVTFFNGRAYKNTEFKEKGTPIVRIQNLTGEGKTVYSDLNLDPNKYIEKGDLIYAWSATFGPYIWKGPKSIYHYHIWKIECDTSQVDKFFLYYLLHKISDNLKEAGGNGTLFIHITKGFIEGYKVKIPPLPTQKAIAEILSSLDDKIELNNQINQNLEALAQALFKQWFVDFEFPNENGEPYKSSGGEMIDSELSEIPKGWEISTIDDITKIVTKGTTPTTIGGSFTTEGINFIKVESISETGAFIRSKFGFIDSETHELLKRSIIQDGDVLFSIAGTIGRVAIATNSILPANTNQAIAILRPEKVNSNFLRLLMKSSLIQSDTKSNVVQAVQANLSLGMIKSTKFILPEQNSLNAFGQATESLIQMIEELTEETEKLIQLRDTLLPKLISGEFEVQQIEKEVYG